MNASLFASTGWMALLFALLHTLWQGAVAAGALFLALRATPVRHVNLRYGLSAAALVTVLLAGFETWVALDVRPQAAAELSLSHMNEVRSEPASRNAALSGGPAIMAPGSTASAGQPQLPRAVADAGVASGPAWPAWAGVFWLSGVAVCLARAVRGVIGAERLRRRCRIVADSGIFALVEELRTRLRLPRRVRVLVSEEIVVPSVMGILWPVVLLPATFLTGVPPEQLRAILAHELAHIRRWDYLVNLGQMVVEALLFFNPFVWWISRQMRVERERLRQDICQL